MERRREGGSFLVMRGGGGGEGESKEQVLLALYILLQCAVHYIKRVWAGGKESPFITFCLFTCTADTKKQLQCTKYN